MLVCFLQCEIIIYGKMQTVTDYLYLFIYMSLVFMKVMSKIITLGIITVFSLQFVQKKKMCPSCKINMYVYFSFFICAHCVVFIWESCADVGGVIPLTLGAYWKIMSLGRWRLILNSDAYFFFPAP